LYQKKWLEQVQRIGTKYYQNKLYNTIYKHEGTLEEMEGPIAS